MTSIRSFALVAAVAALPVLQASANAQTCQPAPLGIVGWWPGNGTAADTIGGNNGQLAGDAGYAPGVVQDGFHLDGFGDYVEIPDSAALRPPRVSVEAWVRFDGLDTPIVSEYGSPGLQYIIFKKNSRVFNFEGFALRKQREAGVDRFVFNVGDMFGGGTTSIAVSTTQVTTGQFYHVVGTYDGLHVRLYVNGALESEVPVTVVVDYATRPVFIGTSGETVFDGKLNGVVDEASIYNRALDAAEVADLYAAGSAGKCGLSTGSLSSLAAFVQALNLSRGISNSLDAKLQNALQALDSANAGDSRAACNRIGAFLNEVRAQSGKALTVAQAMQLTAMAGDVRSELACQ